MEVAVPCLGRALSWPGNFFLWQGGGGGGICFMGCFKGYLNSLENRKK